MKVGLALRILFGTALSSGLGALTPDALAAREAAGPTSLKCDYSVDPLGIDTRAPRLFWRIESTDRGVRQTAFQILVASTPELLARDQGDLWDSGRVKSDVSAGVAYAGKPLVSSQKVFWKIRTWDGSEHVSAW